MKINSLYPAIVWAKADKIVSLYEENFGFRVIHNGKFFSPDDAIGTMRVLENESGFRIDIIQLESQEIPVHGIRMNVDDLDEVLAVYAAKGFIIVRDPIVLDNSKRALVSKDGGAPIMLFQHIR